MLHPQYFNNNYFIANHKKQIAIGGLKSYVSNRSILKAVLAYHLKFVTKIL